MILLVNVHGIVLCIEMWIKESALHIRRYFIIFQIFIKKSAVKRRQFLKTIIRCLDSLITFYCKRVYHAMAFKSQFFFFNYYTEVITLRKEYLRSNYDCQYTQTVQVVVWMKSKIFKVLLVWLQHFSHHTIFSSESSKNILFILFSSYFLFYFNI